VFDRLAQLSTRHPRRIVVVAFVAFLMAGALGSSVAKRLDPYGAEDPATESIQAKRQLEAAGYRPPAVIVIAKHVQIGTARTRARMASLERSLLDEPGVAHVRGYFSTGSPVFVSRDNSSTYIAVSLKATDDKAVQDLGGELAERFDRQPGLIVGGTAVAGAEVNTQVEDDLRAAEMLAFPLLFLLSLLFFRSLVASLLPLLIGGLAIIGTFLILRLASEITSISIFALNLTTALGLGLAIDYSLFIVSRYREEIATSGPGPEAMRRVLATAGRTVFFSALTVAAALASLLVFPQRILYSMGLGGSLVVLLAAAVALTVLPAVLTMLGGRVNAGSPAFLQRRAEADARPDQEGFWYRLSRFVMRRPVPIATLSALLLIVMGLPFFGIKFNTVDPTVLPKGSSARDAYDALNAQFPPYHDTPIRVSVTSARPRQVAKLVADLGEVPGVAEVERPERLENGVTQIALISAAPFNSDASQATVSRVRAVHYPAKVKALVGGMTAEFVDFQSSLSRHLPLALAIAIGTTLIILFLMTGSVVLPIKSLIMNALNLSAVFGLLVLIFQDGRFEGLLGYTSSGGIEQTMPILLFAVAFGLSTDYAVFLLSRIKEARDSGASDSESVAIGLERTGRIVTAAALLFAVAIGALATSKIVFIKENGIGLALAVLIDATIIRALLVPSLMAMLGKWNWWAPAPLRRVYRRWGFSHSLPEKQLNEYTDAEGASRPLL
jgi:uncharacterized membrane protein YdfJ with MMPL/SSD domain